MKDNEINKVDAEAIEQLSIAMGNAIQKGTPLNTVILGGLWFVAVTAQQIKTFKIPRIECYKKLVETLNEMIKNDDYDNE